MHPLDGPLQTLGKGEVGNRLQDIVQRIHGIAADGVLGHIGDEDDHHLRIDLSDLLRGRHAVHKFHFHIHQNDVEVGFVFMNDLISVGKNGDPEGLSLLLFIALKIFPQLLRISRLILHDCNPDHVVSVPPPFSADRGSGTGP